MRENGVLVDGELHVAADDPTGMTKNLIYKPKRSVNVEIPDGYEIDWGEFEVGDSAHTLTVDSDELGYTNVYSLEEVR